MKLLTIDTIDEAKQKINNHVKTWALKTETISTDLSLGRILADDIFSPCDIPSFRRSTVDGYAVIAADTAGAGDAIPVFLKQTGSVLMGKPAGFSIKSGECAYVPTGGMLPDGADAMVMTEYSEQVMGNGEWGMGNGEGAGVVAVYEAVGIGVGVVEVGDDLKKGGLVLCGGTFIRPQEIGALAAAGITAISVFSPLVLSIISSGDELVLPENEPAIGEIRDINTCTLQALAVKHGYHVHNTQVLPDDEHQLEKAVTEAKNFSDIVIISGGSSQGEKDFTARIIDSTATPGVFTHGLAVKPGKPTILGWDEKSKTLFAGLPGHPVSAIMVFELLFGNEQITVNREQLTENSEQGTINREQLTENKEQRAKRRSFPIPAKISCNIPAAPGKTVCQPVILKFIDGCYFAEPVFGKSGMITTLTQADGYIIIEMNREGLNKNEPVQVHLF